MDFKELQSYAREVKAHYGARNAMDDEMEEMYLLEWREESAARRAVENIRVTKSPEGRNKLNGAIRLLTATEPQFTVPKGSDTLSESQADEIEKAARMMWRAAGRVRGDPIHFDVVRSSLIFGEYFISVTDTAKLVEYGQGQAPAIRNRYEQAAKRVPYLFEVHDPRTCYPESDQLGLRSLYREQSMTSREARAQFGDLVSNSLARLKDNSKVTLCDYYDLERRVLWIDGDLNPFYDDEHKLPFIPILANTIEGGRLFTKPEHQAQPFLYGMWKAGLWNRQNMMLTALYTMVYAMGLNPIFVEEQGPSGGEIVIDFSVPGGKIVVPYGSKFYPMVNKGVIDPSLLQALEIANGLVEESTIYSQTLGEPLGKNAAFSMVSLLHQAGRLPLVVAQLKAGWGISDAIRCALLWQREKKQRFKVRYGENQAELDYKSIPDELEVEVKLEVDLPQDKVQMAAVANQLAASGLVSFKWIRENVLSIGQSGEMEEEIWSEQAAKGMFSQMLQAMMQGAGRPPTMGQGGPPMGGPPAGGPPQQPGQAPEEMAPEGMAGPGGGEMMRPPNMPPMMAGGNNGQYPQR